MLSKCSTIVGLAMPSNFRDKNGRDPFTDKSGGNPFAGDGEDLPADSVEGPYAATDAGQSYRPEFEAVLPHRGRLWLWLAIIGLLSAVAGLPIWFLYEIPLGAFALAATLPAGVLAWKDHQAIQRGAMDPTGRAATRWAMLVGSLGTAAGLVTVVFCVFSIVQAIRDAMG
jgi:hypothetical protein